MIKKIIRKLLYSNKITKQACLLRNRFNDWKAIAYPYWKIKVFRPKTVFLVLTPEHGNLGDHAIAIAEKKLLEALNISYCEISLDTLYLLQYNKMLGVFNGSDILVNGGGNLGTLWFPVEELFRKLIQKNPRSKIILFPNTFFYEASLWGETEKRKSQKIYNAHPSLYLFAREVYSFRAMKELYHHVELVPDMVLSMSFTQNMNSRNGCILCLRSDIERTLSRDETAYLQQIAWNCFENNVQYSDMVLPHTVSIANREEEVLKKIAQFQKAELVVTDRLHAMIFCAISATPCIVVDSKSHKLRGTYDWIRHLPYIRFADKVSEVAELIPVVLALHENWYDNTKILPCYDKLKECLLRK